MKILLLISSLFISFFSHGVTLKITHPRIEQRPMQVYELLCEKDCTYTIHDQKKSTHKIDKSKIAAELKTIEDLAPDFSKLEKPKTHVRGSVEVVLHDQKKKTATEIYFPPASKWPKDKVKTFSKFSDALTRLEFLMNKGRMSK